MVINKTVVLQTFVVVPLVFIHYHMIYKHHINHYVPSNVFYAILQYHNDDHLMNEIYEVYHLLLFYEMIKEYHKFNKF